LPDSTGKGTGWSIQPPAEGLATVFFLHPFFDPDPGIETAVQVEVVV